MDVKITVEFVVKNAISLEEVQKYYNNQLYDAMFDLIHNEGLFGIVENSHNLIKVEEL